MAKYVNNEWNKTDYEEVCVHVDLKEGHYISGMAPRGWVREFAETGGSLQAKLSHCFKAITYNEEVGVVMVEYFPYDAILRIFTREKEDVVKAGNSKAFSRTTITHI